MAVVARRERGRTPTAHPAVEDIDIDALLKTNDLHMRDISNESGRRAASEDEESQRLDLLG